MPRAAKSITVDVTLQKNNKMTERLTEMPFGNRSEKKLSLRSALMASILSTSVDKLLDWPQWVVKCDRGRRSGSRWMKRLGDFMSYAKFGGPQ